MPIRWDKFTVKAQEAAQRATDLASEHGNPELMPVHLLAALLEDVFGGQPNPTPTQTGSLTRKLRLRPDASNKHKAIKTILQESPLLDLVGMYSNAESFINEYAFMRPDIVLVDIQLPGMSGIEVIYTVKAEFPEAKFIVLTVSDDAETIFKTLKAGAGGYLLKKNSFENLVEEIVLFSEGGAPITPVIAAKIINYFKQDNVSNITKKLTEKEKDILELIVQGNLYKEIAER